jgi:predicted enzyme related to lactoylglutathione lyase
MAQDMRGAFVWYDHVTSDVDAAKAYYTETIGWGTQPWDGPMPYTMFTIGGRPVAGLMEMPDEMPAGVPPHWLGYVEVGDLDASVAQVKELGGQVRVEPTEIPGIGRFATIADPQGAALALFSSSGDSEEEPIERGAEGNFSWAELNTTDYEGAWEFYSKLFGWTLTSDMDMGAEMGIYRMYQREGSPEGQSMGGMCNAASKIGVPPHWLFYVNVDDIDGAAERVTKNGGKILFGPMKIPGDDMVAICDDPQGGGFAIYAEGEKR